MQGYYNLNEAAKFLSMSVDDLKQMAQKNKIRSFQDRGNLRFRIQDIEEMARQRGAASDPELVLGESPSRQGPRSGASPKPTPRVPPPASPARPAAVPDVFDFDVGGEDVDIGHELFAKIDQGASKKSGLGSSGSRKSPASPKSGSAPKSGGGPKSGSDSDVKLVTDGSDDFSLPVGSDSDVKLVPGGSDVKLPKPSPTPGRPTMMASSSPSKLEVPSGQRPSGTPSKLMPITPAPKSPSRLGPGDSAPKRPSRLAMPHPADSGVRLVPLDSDSDVKIVGPGSDEVPLGASEPAGPTDSDIRLEKVYPPSHPAEESMMLTEEINLDEEIRKQELALGQQPKPNKLKPKSGLRLPATSPFELSDESERPSSVVPEQKPDSSDFDLQATPPQAQLQDDSSDFDLSSAKAEPEADDFSLEMSEEHVLPGHEPPLSGPSSGISLQNPVDAGISLEEGAQDFDLSLEAPEATPKPAQSDHGLDSDSEFELSLDSGADEPAAGGGDDSEFELSLSSGDKPIPAAHGAGGDDSEFDLTLDDSGQLPALEGEEPATEELAGEKDIFETDFEVPALEEEDSSSQVAKLDTDLDSSDFDIALDDSEVAVEDESGSQVVALDDEEADDAASTVAGDEEIEVEIDEEDGGGSFADLGEEGDEEAVVEVEEGDEIDEETGPVREKIVEKLIEPAPWGAMPVVFMFPCVVLMILVGLMGFELIQSSAGYKQAGFITRTFSELLGQKVK